jgi:hypothetical protein
MGEGKDDKERQCHMDKEAFNGNTSNRSFVREICFSDDQWIFVKRRSCANTAKLFRSISREHAKHIAVGFQNQLTILRKEELHPKLYFTLPLRAFNNLPPWPTLHPFALP